MDGWDGWGYLRCQVREQNQDGFTLIELMIVVSIIGILASIAVPGYQQMLLRSKRAELPLNLEGIRLSEISYHHEWEFYTTCAVTPAVPPGRVRLPFPANFTTNLDWNQLGWYPEGPAYGQYGVTATAVSGQLADFTAQAWGDLDGDGNLSNFMSNKVQKSVMVTATNVY